MHHHLSIHRVFALVISLQSTHLLILPLPQNFHVNLPSRKLFLNTTPRKRSLIPSRKTVSPHSNNVRLSHKPGIYQTSHVPKDITHIPKENIRWRIRLDTSGETSPPFPPQVVLINFIAVNGNHFAAIKGH